MSDGVAARGLPRLLRDRILLGAILILALVVRLHTLSARPLWEDEAWSLSFIYLDNPWQIVDFGLRHFHPPLLLLTHYLVYWLNAHMVATTPVGLRAPSVLIGVLAIAAIYQAGATLLTREAGLIAALFSSVNVLQTIHSQEMRMYPLFLLLSWLSIILLANASRSRTIMSWILYGAATFLLIYTHNYAIFVLAAQTIYLLIGMPPGWPARISRVAGIWTFWAVAYAPAIALLLRSVRRHDVLHGGVYQAATLSSLLSTYEHLTVSTGSAVIFLTLIVPFVLFGARRALAMQEFRAAGATAIFLAMTPMLIWCMSPPIPFGRERYFIFSAPALLLLLAFGLVAIRPIGLRLLVIGVMLVASIPALFFYYTSENPRAANDQAAAYVRSQRHPAEPILVGNGLRSFSYYYADEFPRVGSEEWSSFVVRMPRRSITFDPSMKDPMQTPPSTDLYAERIAPGLFWAGSSITQTVGDLDRASIGSFWIVLHTYEPLSREKPSVSPYHLAEEKKFRGVLVRRYVKNQPGVSRNSLAPAQALVPRAG